MKPNFNVAIDGPAGAGKSTIAKLLAKELDLLYIDSGSMYRAITLKALRLKYDFNNQALLAKLAKESQIDLFYDNDGNYRVKLDQQDVTKEIRHPEVSQHVSYVAKVPEVRKHLVSRQQQMAAKGRVIMDGRDIGTRVLPNAEVKFFLTATIEERAKRRQLDLARQGYQVPLDKLIKELSERDEIDRNRSVDPLVPAADAIIVDTTGMTINQVVELLKKHIADKGFGGFN